MRKQLVVNRDLEFLFNYDLDIKNRIVYLYDEINNSNAIKVIQALNYLEAKNKKAITIIINSLGGNIYDGFALYDSLKASRCKIITMGVGSIMSAAALVFLGGGIRKMAMNSTLMVHQTEVELAEKTSGIKIEAREMDRLEKLCNKILEENSNKNAKWWAEQQRAGCMYINVRKAKELKLIDDVIK